MTTERVVEIPWMLSKIPQRGLILDVGSCEAEYLQLVAHPGRRLHCLDPRDCSEGAPHGATFFQMDLIGNGLAAESYDAVVLVSVLEHIGLPFYGQEMFANGDRKALVEIWRLLKPGASAVITVPAGQSKLASWYRQYSPRDLHALFKDWPHMIEFWGFDGERYVEIEEDEVERYEYRESHDAQAGAGAVAGIVAYRPAESYR